MKKKPENIVQFKAPEAAPQKCKPSPRERLDQTVDECTALFREVKHAGRLIGDEYILSHVLGTLVRLSMDIMTLVNEEQSI